MKELVLKGTKIKGISPLLNSSISKLVKLNLEDNEIENECIDVLKKIKLDKLTKLNLYKNKITSIKIFEVLDNLPSLVTFYIGKNPLSEDEMRKNKKKFPFPNNLLKLGITALFNNESIYFLKYLDIENLEILYLSNNNLISLVCINQFDFKNLKELWAPENNLTDINEVYYIQNKETIEVLNLNGNRISIIDDKFLKRLKDFPNLKSINLKKNPINENDKNLQKIRDERITIDM